MANPNTQYAIRNLYSKSQHPTPLIRPISAAETRPMRQSVLRPGKTLEELVYPGDDDPACAHLGAFDEAGRLVGIATVFPDIAAPWANGVPIDLAGWLVSRAPAIATRTGETPERGGGGCKVCL